MDTPIEDDIGGPGTDGWPDSPTEWDFAPVPESEIIACCFWEYARESRTIKLAADMHWTIVRHIWFRKEYASDPELVARDKKRSEIVEEWARSAGFDYDEFHAQLWQTDFPLLGIYDAVLSLVGDSTVAWQRLPADLRAHVTNKVTENRSLSPLCLAWVAELEELWQANSKDLLEVRSRVRDESDDCEDSALWDKTTPIEPTSTTDNSNPEKVTAAVTIDFSRFTDDEIIDTFRVWLKEHRPEQWKKPRRVLPGSPQRGRKQVEYRVALERLGLMRLLHWHSPGDLQKELPDAWARIQSKEADFRREIREARKFFRTLFPFLPEDERPESEERFGSWMPAMLKIAEDVEREMGL